MRSVGEVSLEPSLALLGVGRLTYSHADSNKVVGTDVLADRLQSIVPGR